MHRVSESQHINALYIDGQLVPPTRGGTFEAIDPAKEEVIGLAALGEEVDVAQAVASAKRAFSSGVWSKQSGAQRAQVLRRLAGLIEDNKEAIAIKETRNCGKPLREAEWDIDDVADAFKYYAGLAEKLDGRQNEEITSPDPDNFKITRRFDPVGVVGAIVPWNYPLLMAAWKIAPALASGCSIVVKPSEVTPFTVLDLALLSKDAGVPDGVFNVVTGTGASAGAPLSAHADVDKISFTGSVSTGSKIMHSCADGIRNVTLELGGKSPIIISEDVDIDSAVEWLMFGIFWTNGQICSATSRALIHSSIADQVLDRLKTEAEKVFVGDPFSAEDPSIGPIVNKAQYQRVCNYIDIAKRDGAQLLTGGALGKGKGFYVKPTVFVNVPTSSRAWKEEIFGPVLCVRTFDTYEEALNLANDSDFGLASAILSRDKARAQWFVENLRTGIVWVNCSQPAFNVAPWGGFKKSGIGRDLGEEGFHSFLEVKQVTEYLSSNPWGWYIKSNL